MNNSLCMAKLCNTAITFMHSRLLKHTEIWAMCHLGKHVYVVKWTKPGEWRHKIPHKCEGVI